MGNRHTQADVSIDTKTLQRRSSLHLLCYVCAQLSTHSNGQQKIRYLMRIKQENLSLKQARPYLPAY